MCTSASMCCSAGRGSTRPPVDAGGGSSGGARSGGHGTGRSYHVPRFPYGHATTLFRALRWTAHQSLLLLAAGGTSLAVPFPVAHGDGKGRQAAGRAPGQGGGARARARRERQ